MKIKKGDLIKFPKNGNKEIAIVLHVFPRKKEVLNVYKILYDGKITSTINWKLEKL